MLKTSLKQAFRTPVKSLFTMGITALIAAMLCVGINLQTYARKSLYCIYDQFQVMAVPRFFGGLNSQGELAKARQTPKGYFPCQARNYDFSALEALPGVQSVNACAMFGAYLPAEGKNVCQPLPSPLNYLDEPLSGLNRMDYCGDVVIFETWDDTPVTVTGYVQVGENQYQSSKTPFHLHVLWSAAGIAYSEYITLKNELMEPIVIQPGKQYIAMFDYFLNTSVRPESTMRHFILRSGGTYELSEPDFTKTADGVCSITEYREGFLDTEEGRPYRIGAEYAALSQHSLTVVATDDLASVQPFSTGALYVTEGRGFTQEETESGAQVCVVSENLLQAMGWKVGDTVDLAFYPCSYAFGESLTTENLISAAYPQTLKQYRETTEDILPSDCVFGGGAYTIVGAYGGHVGRFSRSSYRPGQGMDLREVLVPKRSVKNLPSTVSSQYNTTITLDPLRINEFLAAAQAAGITERRAGQYQVEFTIMDQGLSRMAPALEALLRVANTILLVSAAAAALTVAAISVIHVSQRRREIASYRALGLTRRQTVAVTLAGLLLICAVGAALGSFAGRAISDRTSDLIMTTAMEDEGDDTFSEALEQSKSYGAMAEMQFTAGTGTAALVAGGTFFTMLLLTVSLAWAESGKPPIQMIGTKQ